jgi:triosephosphate isomerase
MYIVANWKMHGDRALGGQLVQAALEQLAMLADHAPDSIICPPATLLPLFAGQAMGKLHFGGQDCHGEEKGAFTGDVSAAMLREAGARYVIVGHSERRQAYQESCAQVHAKALRAKSAGLTPIICIGETATQREAGEMAEVLARQIEQSVPAEFSGDDFILAYEPVWAIGSGKVATAEIIEHTHQMLMRHLPAATAILYGGSVKPENLAEILALGPVHGVLVGGASLKPASFAELIKIAGKV